jgi:hypothetical protein
VLTAVRQSLVAGGRFVLVEDLLHRPLEGDDDVAELARRWASPPLRDVAAVRVALAAAGLAIVVEHYLTGGVAVTAPDALERRVARLSRWRRLVPIAPWHRLAVAFLGGCALERLYAHELACYLVFVCEHRA